MLKVIIATIVFLALLGVLAFVAVRQIRKTDPQKADTSVGGDISSAQEFLPFHDIKDGVINMGGDNYAAIIECSSINYDLKTDSEQDMIEVSFQRFVNSLTYPITFFIQTRIIDNSTLLENMRDELIEAIEKYPHMEEYANVYYYEMSNLNKYTHTNKQKKKYIIIPYNEGLELEKLNDVERYEYSVKEARQRAAAMADALFPIGVKARVLDTKELAELVYSTYHRDNYLNYEHIVSGEHLALIVNSKSTVIEEMDSTDKLDWIIYEAQMRIRNEITDRETGREKNRYEGVVSHLEQLRNSYVEKGGN